MADPIPSFDQWMTQQNATGGYATSLNADIGNINRWGQGQITGLDPNQLTQDVYQNYISKGLAAPSNADLLKPYLSANGAPSAYSQFAAQNPNAKSSVASLLGSAYAPFSGTATVQGQSPEFDAHNQGGTTGTPPNSAPGGTNGQPPAQGGGSAPNTPPPQSGAAPGAPLASITPPTPGLTPQFVRNTQTGQIAQVVPGGLKGYGTYADFQKDQAGTNAQPMDVSPEDFSAYQSGIHPGSPSSGTGAPVGGDGTVAPPAPADFIKDYQGIIQSLGLTDIKSAFQDIQKQSADLAQEKADKVANIQNDPWMSQGVKDRNISRINDSYTTKEGILTAKQNLYDSLYKEGLSQAQFLATGEYNQQRDAADLALKKQEALDTLNKSNYQITQANGRQVLVGTSGPDKGKVIADLGADNAVIAAGLKAGGSGDNTSGTAIGTTGTANINSSTPGYATQIVPNSGGLTQAIIDQSALQFALTGNMPSIGLGGTGAAGQKRTAILNRAGEINSSGNIQANKARLTSLNASLTQQVEYANTVERALSNAEQGVSQLTTQFQGKVNDYNAPIANILANAAKYNVGSADVNAFRAGLAEVANEYTQVFSRGGQTSDAVRNRATAILNGNISLTDLAAVSSELQTQGKIVLDGANNQVNSVQSDINGILGGGSSSSGPSSSSSSGSGASSTPIGGTYTYNGTIYLRTGQDSFEPVGTAK